MPTETMTSRERVIRAINHQPVDRVPIDLGSHMSTGAYWNLREHLGLSTDSIWIPDMVQGLAYVDEDVLKRFHCDLMLLEPPYQHTTRWNPMGKYTFTIPSAAHPQQTEDGGWTISKGDQTMRMPTGRYGGFCFGGQQPDGVEVVDPLPRGIAFPNGAKAALLLTFDVEGTYGNGTGNPATEVANYRRLCDHLKRHKVAATFHVVGQMADDCGPEFVNWMLDCGSEVATHGYVHELNKRYGGDFVYAGHYGPEENLVQVREGIDALERIRGGCVRGARVPYGHFNEYTYDAFQSCGLAWASNTGLDDFLNPDHGFGSQPFQMKLGDTLYPLIEIPFDSQTYDWPIWMADDQANASFVDAVAGYCRSRSIDFQRTPAGAVPIWTQRMTEAIDLQSVFTLLCHPINLAVADTRWNDPVQEFLFPIIEHLGDLQRKGTAWIPTCSQLTDFYWRQHRDASASIIERR